jgi:DnaK suppressor protein
MPPRMRKIREHLLARRAAVLTRYKDALDRTEEELATPSSELIETATDQWDARTTSAMTEADVHTLAAIVGALRRLDACHYGICTGCGHRIEPARLAALPEAAECFDCATFAEAPRRVG